MIVSIYQWYNKRTFFVDNYNSYDSKTEKRILAPPKTFTLTITEKECYLIIRSLDLYSRIWIGQYDRINDFSIYDTSDFVKKDSRVHILFQKVRNLMIPSLVSWGDYTSCSLGIWSDETNIKAINAYDIQQRLRYEISWFKKPEGDISVFFDRPWIRGSIGDFTVFCERAEEGINVVLYLSIEQLTAIQTSLEVYRFLINRNIYDAFKYYTSNEEVLTLTKELSIIYKRYNYLTFSSDRNYGEKIYNDLDNSTSVLLKRIKKTVIEMVYVDYIRINIPPANSFIPTEEILKILDQPFEHFRKSRRKVLPDNVLKLPGAGFLTRMYGKEHSTTDYLLVWYDEKTRTEYYFTGEDYVLKHGGRLELPEDIRKYIRVKCNKDGIR